MITPTERKMEKAIRALRTIANYPANSNSDPNEMASALEDIQALAEITLKSLGATP